MNGPEFVDENYWNLENSIRRGSIGRILHQRRSMDGNKVLARLGKAGWLSREPYLRVRINYHWPVCRCFLRTVKRGRLNA